MVTKILKQMKLEPKKYKPLTKDQLAEKKTFEKKKREFEDHFYDIMFELKFYNNSRHTYNLIIDEPTNYGFKGRLFLVPPLTFKKLSENIEVLEENLKCLWVMKYEKFGECAYIDIVTVPLDEEFEYQNPKIKPHQMYLGLNLKMQPIVIDVNKNNMFLIGGATGSGKTRMIWSLLLSYILGCNKNECSLYLTDIAKDEFIGFKYIKHVRYYASELEDLYKMLKYLKIEFEKRKKIISNVRESGVATNIEEYNKIPHIIKLSYVYILIDEFSIIMPSHGDSEKTKQMKQIILDILCMFSKTCRSYGMFPIFATQKTVKDEIPSILKDMAAVRVSYRANGGKSSESLLGDDSAVGLLDRYAIYSLDGGCKKDYMFSAKLTTERLKKLLAPYIDKSIKKIDLDAEIKASEEKIVDNVKVTEIPNRKKEKYKNSLYPVYNSKNIESEDDYI